LFFSVFFSSLSFLFCFNLSVVVTATKMPASVIGYFPEWRCFLFIIFSLRLGPYFGARNAFVRSKKQKLKIISQNWTHAVTIFQEPILRLFNLQLQRQRCSRLGRFWIRGKLFHCKTRHAIRCAVNFYNAGVVTQGRRTGSRFRDLTNLQGSLIFEQGNVSSFSCKRCQAPT
jgi:hypothetical protein